MPESLHDSVQLARSAQRSWSAISIRERLIPVTRLRHLIARDAQELALTVTQDVERSATEVFATDILPTADALLFLERQALKILGPERLSSRLRPIWLFGGREQVNRLPWGIVSIIGTWNYPIFLNAVPMLQAMVAGNAVLWKPSELTPTVANKLSELVHEAGFPAHLLTTLPATREAGPELLEVEIDHLIFTGSVQAGRQIAKRLAERLIPSTLELSGCDATIILEDADIDLAAKAVWYGITLNRGQTCLAVRRVLVQRSIYSAMIEALRKNAPENRPVPLALFSQVEQAEKMVTEAIRLGGEILSGEAVNGANDPPRFPPTLVIHAKPEMSICREASFAPIAAVLPFSDLAEGCSTWNTSPFQLTASIFTNDPKKVEVWAERLPVSTLVVNDVIVPTAHPAIAFGGRKSAGWGVTRGKDGLLAMTTPQAILTRTGKFRPHYDGTDSPGTPEILNGMLQWKHSQSFGNRWKGFWEMIRGMKRSRG